MKTPTCPRCEKTGVDIHTCYPKSKTPRTDALVQPSYGIKEINMLIFHARKLEQELNEAKADWKTKRDELIHKKFFFQPHPDDAAKCNCAYCARDFEAMAEHAAYMEMELFDLREVAEARGCAASNSKQICQQQS